MRLQLLQSKLHLLSNWTECDRGDSFPFDFEQNGIAFSSKSQKRKLSPGSYFSKDVFICIHWEIFSEYCQIKPIIFLLYLHSSDCFTSNGISLGTTFLSEKCNYNPNLVWSNKKFRKDFSACGKNSINNWSRETDAPRHHEGPIQAPPPEHKKKFVWCPQINHRKL